jgi:hypothetical protein
LTLSKTSCPVGQITGICSTSRISSPRRETGRVFSIEPPFSPLREQRRSNPIVAERFGKNLTRRANHRHMFNIARILEPAPENWSRAFNRAAFFRHREEQSEEAIRSLLNDPEKI